MPKVLSALSTIEHIINRSTLVKRTEDFDGMLFIATSWPAFVTNFQNIVVLYVIKTETAKTIRLIHFMLFYRYRIHVVGLHD